MISLSGHSSTGTPEFAKRSMVPGVTGVTGGGQVRHDPDWWYRSRVTRRHQYDTFSLRGDIKPGQYRDRDMYSDGVSVHSPDMRKRCSPGEIKPFVMPR